MSEETTPWYRDLFESGDYARFWLGAGLLTPERTTREVDFIVEALDLWPGARVLDLCCGQGRHSVALAARGYRVVGLDLSPSLLGMARAAAQEADVPVEWVEADMRDIPKRFAGSFDAAINIFTAFGYLESDAEDQKVLDAVSRSLKPAGKFLIDTSSSVGLFRVYRATDWEEIDAAAVLRRRRFDFLSGRMHEEMTIIEPDGSRRTRTFSVRQYLLTDLAAMLDRAGMAVERYWGGFDGSELTMDSRRLIVLAKKR